MRTSLCTTRGRSPAPGESVLFPCQGDSLYEDTSKTDILKKRWIEDLFTLSISINAVYSMVRWYYRYSIELFENGVATHFRVIPLISMRKVIDARLTLMLGGNRRELCTSVIINIFQFKYVQERHANYSGGAQTYYLTNFSPVDLPLTN